MGSLCEQINNHVRHILPFTLDFAEFNTEHDLFVTYPDPVAASAEENGESAVELHVQKKKQNTKSRGVNSGCIISYKTVADLIKGIKDQSTVNHFRTFGLFKSMGANGQRKTYPVKTHAPPQRRRRGHGWSKKR